MRKKSPVTTVALVGAVMTLLGVALGARLTKAAETPANDCLIAIEDDGAFVSSGKVSTLPCTDGAACDADGATDGKCTVKVRACVKLAGCESRSLKSSKVNPKKLNIVVPSSACGSFVDVLLAKDKGKKSKKTLKAIATGTETPAKRNKDTDKVKVSCVRCTDPSGSCVTSTTTTSTTTSTTTTTNPCGNGVIDAGETCDPDAVPNGCSGGTPFCDVGTCASCKATCTQLAFSTGAPTPSCSFPGAGGHGQPPYSGEIDGDPVGMCLDTVNGKRCNNGDPGNTSLPNYVTGLCAVDADCNACKSGFCDNGSLGTGAAACTVNADCTKLFDLGVGCLYIGGGLASIVPPGPTPDGSTTLLGIADCSVNSVTLEPADTGSPRNCTIGPNAASKHCVNGHPGTDGQGTCSTDNDCAPACVNDAGALCGGSDTGCHCNNGAPGLPGKDLGTCSVQGTCGGTSGVCSGDGTSACGCDFDCNGGCTQDSNCTFSSAGVCQPDPSCFFGNPLPIDNAGTSTCVLNVVGDGVTGTADISAGTADTTLPLKSFVYLTGVDADNFSTGHPCPICDNGTCNAGPRKGLSCETNSSLMVTHDCPPPSYLFLAPLDVTLGPLTTATTTKSDAGGIFCPAVGAQADAGAFGVQARQIVENGSVAAGGLDLTEKAATLASIFCIPATNNGLIDASANLPGPGATALGGTVRLR